MYRFVIGNNFVLLPLRYGQMQYIQYWLFSIHVNAARFILDKPFVLLKLESNNTVDTYGWHKRKNQQ